MKRTALNIVFGIGVLIFLFGYTAEEEQENSKTYLPTLSAYGFFDGELAKLQPTEGVVPYDVNTSLFSDYASKSRFVKIPKGQAAIYQNQQVFDFPKGTALIKTFFYPKDANKPNKGNILLETRVLLYEEEGWVALPYMWNEAQTEAYLEVAGGARDIQWKDEKGKKQKLNYRVPNMVDCKGCHSYNQTQVPIGLSARQLNRDFVYETGIENQLLHWQKLGLLQQLPEDQNWPKLAQWEDASSPIAIRARSYLDANCGYCHSPEGPANTSGMFLDIHTDSPAQWGVGKSPVAAERGSGGRLKGIVPGKPHESILTFRLESTDPGIRMPEIGRQIVDKEGLEVVKEWIKRMEK